jgi:hypothetical protein
MDDPLLIIALVAVVGFAALGVYFYVRSRPVEEEPVYYYKCVQCKRRLRYRRRQAGHRGACPRCRASFSFPEVPADGPSRR